MGISEVIRLNPFAWSSSLNFGIVRFLRPELLAWLLGTGLEAFEIFPWPIGVASLIRPYELLTSILSLVFYRSCFCYLIFLDGDVFSCPPAKLLTSFQAILKKVVFFENLSVLAITSLTFYMLSSAMKSRSFYSTLIMVLKTEYCICPLCDSFSDILDTEEIERLDWSIAGDAWVSIPT